jgi:hypothetical protein
MKMFTDQWIMRNAPLLLFALLALGLIASVYLLFSAQGAIQRQARKNKRAIADLAKHVSSVLPAIPQAPREVDAEIAPAAYGGPGAARPPLNVSKRIQALRLLRRGQDIAHVSAVLGMTRKEIELLLRVQQMASAQSMGKLS